MKGYKRAYKIFIVFFYLFMSFVVAYTPIFCYEGDGGCVLDGPESDCTHCENFGDCIQSECSSYLDFYIPNIEDPKTIYLREVEVLKEEDPNTLFGFGDEYFIQKEILTYNKFGSPTWILDGEGNEAKIKYTFCGVYQEESELDPDNFHVMGTINYEPDNCLALSISDANDVPTYYYYDDYFRLHKIVKPLDSEEEPSLEYVYSLGKPEDDDLNILTKSKINDNTYLETTTYYDGLGRVYKTKVENGEQDIYVYNLYDYDIELVSHVSKPSYSSGPFIYSRTEYSHDPLLRPTMIWPNSDQTDIFIESSYGSEEGLYTLKVKDEEGKYIKSFTDAYGRLKYIKDNSNDGVSFLYTTSYDYDLLGNLINIIDSEGRIVETNEYNSLGQLIYNSHIDIGDTYLQYDNKGNIVSRLNNRNRVITDYDGFNRPIHIGVAENE